MPKYKVIIRAVAEPGDAISAAGYAAIDIEPHPGASGGKYVTIRADGKDVGGAELIRPTPTPFEIEQAKSVLITAVEHLPLDTALAKKG